MDLVDIRHLISRIFHQKLRKLESVSCFSPLEAMLIFSEPRGGSTWLTEIIRQVPKTAVIWEPLNPKKNPDFKKLKFGWRQFIPDDAEWPEAKNLFSDLLAGKIINNPNTFLERKNLNSYLEAEKLVIKFCRGNALLPWLVNQFDFKFKPIYLVRHPLSVLASQLRHGNWDYKYKGFHIPNSPFSEIYEIHEDFFRSLRTKEEALIAQWVLTNLIPLNHENNNKKWITVNYEDLLVNPKNELKRIFEIWQISQPESIDEAIAKPSKTVKTKVLKSKIEQTEQWKTFMSSSQLESAQAIFDHFKFNYYNIQSGLPKGGN